MKRIILFGFAMINCCMTTFAQPTPTPLIFDTDIGNDCDDVLAMGVIHALQSRGLCRLVAVTITKDQEQCAPFTDAINTFYGRGDIPIGVCRSGITPQQSRFTGLVADQDNGIDRYPHNLRSGKDAPDAVAVLRKALAAEAVTVDDRGATTHATTANGLHRYLTLTHDQQIRVTEALVQLSSEPPHGVFPQK